MRFLHATLPITAILLAALAGCKAEDEIARTEIEHPDREELRLRVGIVKGEKLVWFFRLSGPADLVGRHAREFDDFFGSVTVEAGKDPTWTDPKGWRKDPPGGDRLATFRVGEKPRELEIAITQLPAEGFDLTKNVHRWQKQVNLPPAESPADLARAVRKIKGEDVMLVDLTGRGVHTVSKMPDPHAANKKKFVPALALKKAAQGGGGGGGGGRLPFTYQVPKGWDKRAPGQFAAEAYEVAEKISVTLTPAGGDLAENINRWRGQVELPRIGPAELRKTTSELVVAGMKSVYVDLANPAGPKDKNRIVGVIVPMEDSMWFVKMTGPLDLVGQHKKDFEAFVTSFKLTK